MNMKLYFISMYTLPKSGVKEAGLEDNVDICSLIKMRIIIQDQLYMRCTALNMLNRKEGRSTVPTGKLWD